MDPSLYLPGELSRIPRGLIQNPTERIFDDSVQWERSGIGLQSLIQLWARNKVLIAAVFAAIFLSSIAWIVASPRSYEAVVKIFVKRARIETLGADRDTPTAAAAEVSESDILSEIEILRSRQLLDTVVDRCALARPFERQSRPRRLAAAMAAKNLLENLRIIPVSKTNIIEVTYISRDPNQAASILKALTVLYLEKHTALHRSHETSQFFGDQATRYKADLAVAQQKLSDFQQRYEASLLDERKELNLRRISDLTSELQQLNADIEDTNHRLQLLNAQKDSLSPTIESQVRTARNDALLEKLKADLLDLQNRRTELLTKFEPSHRLVIQVNQQISDTRDAIKREEAPAVVDRTDTPNPLRQSAEAEVSHAQSQLVGLLARRESLMADIGSARGKQKVMDQLTAEYNDLQRGKNITEGNYLLYEKKTEEAHIADALDQHKFLNVSILEDPTTPALPREKHSSFVAVLGLVLGITCAFLAAKTAEALHPVIRSPGELTLSTNLPVLATFSGGTILSSIDYDGDAALLSAAFATERASDVVEAPGQNASPDPNHESRHSPGSATSDVS